jgi:tricorn protease
LAYNIPLSGERLPRLRVKVSGINFPFQANHAESKKERRPLNRMMRNSSLLLVFVALMAVLPAAAQDDKPLLLRQPTLSGTDIVFVYGGDLWRVSRSGGDAIRLTSGPGIKQSPHFSPDGKWIAFTGEYDGRAEVYVVPSFGGAPRRITYNAGPATAQASVIDDTAANTAIGWTPDGKNILFTSGSYAYAFGVKRLYTVSIDGGLPTELPLPLGYEGSYSQDGSHIAYRHTPHPWGTWSHYRGGAAGSIWIANLADSSVVPIPREDWNDTNPMWVGDTIYYLSDRNGPFTLFAYDTKTQKSSQLIENTGLPIKNASAGPGAIVYEQFGSLHLYDLASHAEHAVTIHVASDLVETRPHFEKVAKHIDNAVISPSGVRAAFEAHGEILTVPAEKGDIRNITNSPGVAERDPAWSPDGKSIAYFSDESGEYALHIRGQNGLGGERKIKLGVNGFYYSPQWSPDSKKIAYTDKWLNLWYVDIDKGTPVKVETALYEAQSSFDPRWSPDSKWLVYSNVLKNHFHAVFVYSLDSAKSTQITDGMSDAHNPVFDRGGKYIFFVASTNRGPAIAGLDMSSDPHTVTSSPYVIVLQKNQPSPLAPESDEEKAEGEQGDKKDQSSKAADSNDEKQKSKKDKSADQNDEKKDADKDKDKKKEEVKVAIDFDGISQRILALPIPTRSYIATFAGKAGEFFLVALPSGQDLLDDGPPALELIKFDLSKRKTETLISGASALDLSFNGEKFLYQQGDDWFIAATAAPAKPGEGKLKMENMEVWTEPRAEWNQMFHEIWRIERDFFYDPHWHGVNLAALEKEYSRYLDGIATREDLNDLFFQMLSEINVGHMFVGGGTFPEIRRENIGLLGADYEIANGRYRFRRVIAGENWNPHLQSPLTQPGVNVVAGEYLLAVNGRDVGASDSVYRFFQDTAGKQTVLRVGPNADGKDARDVTVVPIDDEGALRNRAWIEANLHKVDELSNGRLAYVYLPNTAGGGYTNFNRYYFAQNDKQGAVIDERFNAGGQAADYIIEYMQRKPWSYWTAREGGDGVTPQSAIYGPKAIVTNEFSGSGGDLLPWLFRLTSIGPLVGKRTWGGLVGIRDYPSLIDGGFVTAPRFAFYTTDGKWDVENHGVPPDYDVDLDPHAWREGHDPQLEKAVQVVLDELAKNPPPEHHHPPYPDYSRYSSVH